MQIAKTCKTIKEADRHYMRLCNKYESVKLVRGPVFSEGGQYVWEVSNRKPPPMSDHAERMEERRQLGLSGF